MDPMSVDKKRRAVWHHHLQEETDAAFLYGYLSKITKDANSRGVFEQLADVEKRHIEVWLKVFADHGLTAEVPKPSRRARFLAAAAKIFGTRFLVTILIKEEAEEVASYLKLHRESVSQPERDSARLLAKESAIHAETLSDLGQSRREPWHQTGTGGYLRNVVYGFNDGLTANFGLVAGVIGASVRPDVVLLSGLAGAIADALSMGASGYLAAKSEQEVYEKEIRMEQEELRVMPELEKQELALIYQLKGVEPERARRMAEEIMRDPEQALIEKTREELKIGDPHATPWREAWVTGTSTAVGAMIPVFPLFLFEGWLGIWIAFTLAMVMHFGVGAARTVFTRRSFWRSGLDMFIVGFGVAVVGYLVGDLFTRWIS